MNLIRSSRDPHGERQQTRVRAACGGSTVRVGVISDTHGLLRPEAVAALAGCDLILHAGDVGDPAVLTELERLAPVSAVRGNVDCGPWALRLPERVEVELAGALVLLLHDASLLGVDPRGAGYAAVVAGHSHRPHNERRDGVLYFNPGAAGPRRFRLPICVGRLQVHAGHVVGEIVLLNLA